MTPHVAQYRRLLADLPRAEESRIDNIHIIGVKHPIHSNISKIVTIDAREPKATPYFCVEYTKFQPGPTHSTILTDGTYCWALTTCQYPANMNIVISPNIGETLEFSAFRPTVPRDIEQTITNSIAQTFK